jgi:hypothetical protein
MLCTGISGWLRSEWVDDFARNQWMTCPGIRSRLARTSTVFSEVEEVYLDSCIEIKSIPRNGFMAYYKETRSECNESISTALVGVRPNHHLAAYENTGGQSAD